MPGIQFLDLTTETCFYPGQVLGGVKYIRRAQKQDFFCLSNGSRFLPLPFPIVADFFLCFSNCNRLVSEVTFTLFSGGSNNESGLTLDCSFRFSTKRERGEREGRQTNSLKGQILAVGERSQPFPICSYFRLLRQLHIIFNFCDCLPYFPGSRFNPFLHTLPGQVTTCMPFFVR